MLGMLVAAGSQTIVSPAMPVIVAELGGIEFYSWVLTAVMLTSAVIVPIVGKLSDIYGRREFFIGGLVIFMLGSALAGAAQGFWWLVAARVVQGVGMGAIIPLSQAIIGDIISPQERGKYMGYMGGVFGLASIAGPLAGGWIAESFSWRWLFYVNLPIGVVALIFIFAFFKLPHTRTERSIDYAGFVTLGVSLTLILLATSWGGVQFPWASWQIFGLYGVGAIMLGLFIWSESRAEEPVIPLELWKSPVFTLSNLSNLFVSMGMFGAILYLPLYAQGVIGLGIAESGLILIPLTVSMIVVSTVVGRLITRTGKYKAFTLAGTAVMAFGYFLLSQLGYGSTRGDLITASVVVGLGLGAVLQTYILIVQNSTTREMLGVSTAVVQFSRSAGATLGAAIFGAIITAGMAREVPDSVGGEGASGIAALLDPTAFQGLSPSAAEALSRGLADAMHPVFVAGIPIIAVAFVLTLFIEERPLKTTAFVDEDEEEGDEGAGSEDREGDRSKVLFAGAALNTLASRIETANGDAPKLILAASSLVPDAALSERERANRAAKNVIRPMAVRMFLAGSRSDRS
ncbi:MAG: MFS transporter [Rubrobacter sp.]|nr:MFS transporter [Rubrobacter sp.]